MLIKAVYSAVLLLIICDMSSGIAHENNHKYEATDSIADLSFSIPGFPYTVTPIFHESNGIKVLTLPHGAV